MNTPQEMIKMLKWRARGAAVVLACAAPMVVLAQAAAPAPASANAAAPAAAGAAAPIAIQAITSSQQSGADVVRIELSEALTAVPGDRKSTRLNSSHPRLSRMPSSA